MKKQLLIGTLLTAMATGAWAQKPDTARVMVHYKFTWLQDTTNRAHPYTENMVLYVGQSASAYRSYDGIVYNVQFKKAWAESAAASPDGHSMINRRGVGTPEEYYQYPNDNKLARKEPLLMNSYLIEDVMPAIDWKISSDTATFGGLHCQKATCFFKGRDYTAWFCPDMPVRTGPWKLNGLPGVIVDAHDAKNEVVFKFDGVEKTIPTPKSEAAVDEKDLPPILQGLDDDMNLIGPPARTIKTTQKEYDKLTETLRKNPQALEQAMNTSRHASGEGTVDHIKVVHGPMGPAINNPIELPEKK